jgi:phage terminase small subunit
MLDLEQYDLTPKQRRFVEEYLVDLNATQAYLRAGYKAKTNNVAGVEAHKLLKNPKVKAAVAAAMEARSARTQVTADRVVQELAKLGFSKMTSFARWGPDGIILRDSEQLSEEDAACVAGLEQTTIVVGEMEKTTLKFKLHDKKGALTELGRHLGIFIDKTEVTGKDGGPITLQNLRETIEGG